jgi:hypothetical protein
MCPICIAVAGLVATAVAGPQTFPHLSVELLVIGLGLAILLPPLLNGKYKPIMDGRYLMPLVPVLFVGIGVALVGTAHAIRPGRLRPPALALLALFGALLVGHPLALLAEYYDDSQHDGLDNALYLQTLDQLKAARADGEMVLLDPRLREVKTLGSGNAGSTFTWLLAVSGLPSSPYQGDPAELPGRLAVLRRQTADLVDDQLDLLSLDGRRFRGMERPNYRAYRVAAP